MDAPVATDIEAVRAFNRFYTQRIGVLREALLDSPFSLAEARVLYELARREQPTSSGLCRELSLDPGYLSRILRRFEKERLLGRRRSTEDGRQYLLALTKKGRAAFAALDKGSRRQVGGLLKPIAASDRARVVAAMAMIEQKFRGTPAAAVPYLLRTHRPGDIGWVVGRHGAIYAEEYGWDESFEALVAEIAAKFLRHYDEKRERCWIAERQGVNVGSVFLVKQSSTVAKLRLLLVEPEARGLGIGGRLVEECVGFARRAGYRKVTLWTQSILVAARRIYEHAGFHLVREEPHRSFGHDLVGEHWERTL
ncbi:MAG TPA: bifunctional helix-turn-helix transcriptional regulator/GNAT family N-acetyltransferase [Stellaceae bacterium]|nr:bifunctional helix-turn-helix transcriptional regulator/GNAT family N-acetyltransferase [Stellaceae bacterium]